MFLLAVLLFWPWLRSGQSLYGSDFILLNYPQIQAIRESLLNGRLPLWSDAVFSGYPLFADPQVFLFYPPAWPLFLSDAARTLGWYVLIHLVVAGLGVSAVARALGASPWGSFLGGACFMLGTSLPLHIQGGHLPHLQVTAWMPWLLRAALAHFRGGRRETLGIGAVVLALCLLGGHPQMAFYSLLLLGWLAFLSPRLGGMERLRALRSAALLSLLGFLLAAVSLLPALELTLQSARATTMDYSFRTMGSLPPPHLLTVLLPRLFGSVPGGDYWPQEPIHYLGTVTYHGLLPLLVLAFLRRSHLAAGPWAFFVWPLPVSLLLALGSHTPLYRLVVLLPGFNLFRTPQYALILSAFALSGLAALGFSRLEERPGDAVSWARGALAGAGVFLGCGLLLALLPAAGDTLLRSVWQGAPPPSPSLDPSPSVTAARQCSQSGVVLLLMALALAWWGRARSRRFLRSLPLAAVVVGELLFFSRGLIAPVDLPPHYPSLSFRPLLGPGTPCRVMPLGGDYFSANEPLLAGWRGIGGNNTLVLADYVRLLGIMEDYPWPNPHIIFTWFANHRSPVARILDACLLVSPAPLEDQSLEEIHAGSGLWFYRQGASLGRAVVYPRVRSLPREELIRALGDFDPARELLAEGGQDLRDGPAREVPVHPARVDVVHGGYLTVTDPLAGGGYLLVSQAWYPGWEAHWSGGRLPVLKGDLALTLVPLPPGCATVRLVFRPWSLGAGVLVSLLAAAGILVWCRSGRRPRSAATTTTPVQVGTEAEDAPPVRGAPAPPPGRSPP